MAHDLKDLEERFLAKLLLNPAQLPTTGIQPEDFQAPLIRAAFRAITEVSQVYGLQRNFMSLVGDAMNKLDFIRNRPISPHRYLNRISQLETCPEGLDHLAAKIEANSPRIQKEMAQIVENYLTGRIITAIQNFQEGLSRTEINNLFGRHKTRAQLQQAINSLINHGLIASTKKRTPGRSVELFTAKKA